MGTVYLGRLIDGTSAQTVAIKVLHPHLATNPEMVAMFLDEARVATRLRHPNLVGVLDMDMIGEELVIVMEYVEGTTLARMQSAVRRRGERLPVGVSVRIVCDALAGLNVVHELLDESGQSLGLVHRDVSPHNLLVGSDGSTRVTDFGIALAAGRLASTRPDGTLKGKLQYLSPEQIGRKAVDRRVDVFAAGIVLWECLTGERLFQGKTEAETVTRVLRDPIAPPSLMRPEVSTELDEVCLQALERDPQRRFKTADDFGNALRHAFGPLVDASQVGLLVCDLAADAIRTQRASLDRGELVSAGKPQRTKRLLAMTAVGLLAVGAAAPFALRLLRAPPGTAPRPVPMAATTLAPFPAFDESRSPSAPVSAKSAEADLAHSALSTPVPTSSTEADSAGHAASPKGRNASARSPGDARTPVRQPPKAARPFMPNDL
jgi:serine/threonine-protein kinase